MNRWIRWLSVLLALQLVLGIVLHFTTNRLAATPPAGTKLLAAAPDSIDQLTIEGPAGKKVVLQKKGGDWQLPDEAGFPADGAKVNELFTHLAGVKTGAPVSSTRESRARFKVAADAFERRVTLASAGKSIATLYLGDAPSAREVHLRRDGEDAVYDVDLGTWEFPVQAADWEDRTLLQMPPQDIQSIAVDGLTLARAAPAATTAAQVAKPASSKPATPGWQATQGLKPGETLDAMAADTLAQRIANLQTGAVLGRSAQPDYGLAKPELQLSVVRNGKAVDYTLGKQAKGTDYVLKSSARAEYFQLPASSAQPLLDAAKRAALVMGPAGGGGKAKKAA